MKRLFSAKPLIAAAIALGALGATSMAQARDDVRFTIAVGEPHGQYHQYQPYHQPAPVYRGYDRFDHDRFGPMGDADRDGVPNRFDRDSRFFDARATYRSAQWSDFDHDGVPNRFDRAPRNPRRY
jgi:hypothetical protein